MKSNYLKLLFAKISAVKFIDLFYNKLMMSYYLVLLLLGMLSAVSVPAPKSIFLRLLTYSFKALCKLGTTTHMLNAKRGQNSSEKEPFRGQVAGWDYSL
jgi:hypothetical protein